MTDRLRGTGGGVLGGNGHEVHTKPPVALRMAPDPRGLQSCPGRLQGKLHSSLEIQIGNSANHGQPAP